MLHIISDKKAMTLPEIIITVMLVSVVIGAGIMPFVMQQGMIKAQMARSDIQDQVSVAMAYINKDVFRSSTAEIDSSSTTEVLNDILTLTINDTDGTPMETIVYTLDRENNQLLKNTQAISNKITNSTYNLNGNNLVEVQITAEDGAQTLASSTAFALRATRAIS
jgi:prepilin-type N-terminal cleavage/methylation domain-containing protein